MDMKKVLVLGLFLVVAVSAVAAISATEELTLDGIQFKIPDGYNVVEKSTDTSDSNDKEDIDGTIVDTEVSSEYKNAAGDELEFKVGTKNNGKIDSINLTNAQKKVVSQIKHDMSSPVVMNRLVQGDVGSGKTAVLTARTMRILNSGTTQIVLHIYIKLNTLSQDSS